MKNLPIYLMTFLITMGCNTTKPSIGTNESPTSAETTFISSTGDERWIPLFDGKSTNGWRNYQKKTSGKSWVVKDGTLVLEVVSDGKGKTKSEDGGDLITVDQYENFELSLEWKISECGNSGVLFNVVEDEQYERVYHTGPEMQILDNTCHPDAKIHTHRAGDLYDLIACSEEVVKPAGEWNRIVIRINAGQAEFFLNEQKVVDFIMFDQSWNERIAKSKFKDMPGFGKSQKGHIALQDHGDAVAFRDIKIRLL